MKDGVLSVKLPANARTNRLSKAWSKKYVAITQQPIAGVDTVSNCLMISIYPAKNLAFKQSKGVSLKPIFQHCFSARSSVLFRCKSRTQPHAFTICENAESKIHLSGESESESQQWIRYIRNLLWPPSSFIELEKTFGNAFEVSIIDNEYTHRAGLLGMYGHLTICTKKAVLSHPQTGHVIQEWYLNTLGFKLLPQNNEVDKDKIVAMILESNSSTGFGTIVLFCENANGIIERVHKVRQMFETDAGYGEKVTKELLSTPTDENENIAECYTHYHVPRRDGKRVDFYDPPPFKFERPISDTYLVERELVAKRSHSQSQSHSVPKTMNHRENSRLFGWKNIVNIPESMLDCSINSSALNQRRNKSESESSSEDDGIEFLVEEETEIHNQPLQEEENIYAEVGEMVDEQTEMQPPELPPKKNKNKMWLNLYDIDAEHYSYSIPLSRPRSSTIDVASSNEFLDHRFSKLFDDIQTMKMEHKQFVEYIRQALTADVNIFENEYATIASKCFKRRSSCDYCFMRPIVSKETQNENEYEYVDMNDIAAQ